MENHKNIKYRKKYLKYKNKYNYLLEKHKSKLKGGSPDAMTIISVILTIFAILGIGTGIYFQKDSFNNFIDKNSNLLKKTIKNVTTKKKREEDDAKKKSQQEQNKEDELDKREIEAKKLKVVKKNIDQLKQKSEQSEIQHQEENQAIKKSVQAFSQASSRKLDLYEMPDELDLNFFEDVFDKYENLEGKNDSDGNSDAINDLITLFKDKLKKEDYDFSFNTTNKSLTDKSLTDLIIITIFKPIFDEMNISFWGNSSCNTDQIKNHQKKLVEKFNNIYKKAGKNLILNLKKFLNFFKFLKYILEIENIFLKEEGFAEIFNSYYKNANSDCISILFDLEPKNETDKSLISNRSSQIENQSFKLLTKELDRKINILDEKAINLQSSNVEQAPRTQEEIKEKLKKKIENPPPVPFLLEKSQKTLLDELKVLFKKNDPTNANYNQNNDNNKLLDKIKNMKLINKNELHWDVGLSHFYWINNNNNNRLIINSYARFGDPTDSIMLEYSAKGWFQIRNDIIFDPKNGKYIANITELQNDLENIKKNIETQYGGMSDEFLDLAIVKSTIELVEKTIESIKDYSNCNGNTDNSTKTFDKNDYINAFKKLNDLNTLLNIQNLAELKKLENATVRYFLIQTGKMEIENNDTVDEELKKELQALLTELEDKNNSEQIKGGRKNEEDTNEEDKKTKKLKNRMKAYNDYFKFKKEYFNNQKQNKN